MTNAFLMAFLAIVLAPVLARHLLRIDSVFPLAFMQMLFGIALNVSGGADLLARYGIALGAGGVGDSLRPFGWLGLMIVVALTAAAHRGGPTGSAASLRRLATISVAGFGTTCAIGAGAGYALLQSFPSIQGDRATPLTFCLGMGLTLAVTALPVLISILENLRIESTPLGRLAIGCAVLDDVWLWLMMAVIMACMAGSVSRIAVTIVLFVCYAAAMLAWVPARLERLYRSHAWLRYGDGLLFSMAILLASQIVANAIGVHAIVGAFLAGAALPADALRSWREPIMRWTQVVLLPFFFVLSGVAVHIDIASPLVWGVTAVVTLCAMLGKFSAVSIAARAVGMPWQQAFGLGAMLQCKGLMELVAINILLQAKIIGPTLFQALTMLALVSTFLTAPLLRLIFGRIEHASVRTAPGAPAAPESS